MTKQTKPAENQADSELQSPIADEAAVNIYPLELVARIASKVFDGRDYSKAAKVAVALLDAFRSELVEQTRKRAIVQAAEQQRRAKHAAVERDQSGKVVFKSLKEAIRIITGEPREERAMPKYRRFIAHQIRQSRATDRRLDLSDVKPTTEKKVQDYLKAYGRTGMRHDFVLGQQQAFGTWKMKDASDMARERALGKSNPQKT